MISVTTTVSNEGLLRRFEHAGSAIRARIRTALGYIGQQVADRARAGAPHRTGDLQGSIAPFYVETQNKQAEVIKAGAFYAIFLEHGTVSHGGAHNKNAGKGKKAKLSRLHQLRAQGVWRIQPRPFMSPALAALRSQIHADLSAALTGAVEDAKE